MRKLSFVLGFLVTASCLSAQSKTKYPYPILGGQTVIVPANHDTLWVFKHSQYKRAVKIAEEHKVDSLITDVLQQKLDLTEDIITEKDSLIAAYRRGYDRYRHLWEETDLKLQEAEVKAAQRFNFLSYGFVAGAVTTAIVGVFLIKD